MAKPKAKRSRPGDMATIEAADAMFLEPDAPHGDHGPALSPERVLFQAVIERAIQDCSATPGSPHSAI